MPKDYDIRTVAIYLRKSRGQNNEEIDDLKQHRAELISMCEERGWAFTEYAEIGTGDKISVRPKMLELLQDVEQQMYDAVVAVHFDRLSRGDEVDQARIKKTFAMTETLFVTLSKLEDSFFADKISEERYMMKKAEYERRICELEEEYQIISKQADNTQNVRNEDMLDSVRKVMEFINNPDLDPKDLNRAYKSIIHSIEWERDSLDEKGVMKVNFL